MKKNMGSFDRLTRLLIALGLIALYFTHLVNGVPGIVLLAIAGIFVLTSFVGYCPAYSVFRFRSNNIPNGNPGK
jgi:hypothetical protein